MKTHLGHYEIVAELGRGGMGVVYKGFEPALNRHVAIKELSPTLAHDPSLVERFLREARSMAALNDPHIIQIYFIGTDETTGQPFFVMEFVEGESLSQILKREHKLSVANALKIIQQAAQGLASAHDKGVIHRDIKPGNLMVTPRGQVKIADFGIALATHDLSKKLTSTGEFVGTPGYLSPEVCLGKQVDQRSDIFSLGIVLYEMLTGDTPFRDQSPLGLMLEVVKAEIPDIRQINGEVDPQTAAILIRMVAKEPSERFQSCHDLVAALGAHPQVAKGGPIQLSAPPAPAMATVIGAPTPAEQAKRGPTPPPRVPAAAPAEAVATRAAAGPPRPSVLDRPQKTGSSRVGLAVAAGVVLMLGGTAFAFRGQISDLVRGFTGGDYPNTLTAGQTDNPANASKAMKPGAGASTQATETNGTAAADDVRRDDGRMVSLAAVDPVTPPPAAPVDAVKSTIPTGDASRPALAASAADSGAQVAKASAPRRVAPPRSPRVAVVAIGDNAITSPVETRIESVLMREGFDLLEEEMVAGVERAIRGCGCVERVPELMRVLGDKVEVLVLVRAEEVGSQIITYYGQASELYTAYLGVKAYSVADKRQLGFAIREKVDFTTLNAEEKAMEVIEPGLSDLVDDLSPYRPKSRG